MARENEQQCLVVVQKALGASLAPTPEWLIRPGKEECRSQWELVCSIYRDLTGMVLPDTMRRVERRTVDAVLIQPGVPPRIFEFDEPQHFNCYRAQALRQYPANVPLAFDAALWLSRSDEKTRLEGGGFARAMPPLFPQSDGRHRQRAFRDALCDLLPFEYGFAPTLRIGLFEVQAWLHSPTAGNQMTRLLEQRLSPNWPTTT